MKTEAFSIVRTVWQLRRQGANGQIAQIKWQEHKAEQVIAKALNRHFGLSVITWGNASPFFKGPMEGAGFGKSYF